MYSKGKLTAPTLALAADELDELIRDWVGLFSRGESASNTIITSTQDAKSFHITLSLGVNAIEPQEDRSNQTHSLAYFLEMVANQSTDILDNLSSLKVELENYYVYPIDSDESPAYPVIITATAPPLTMQVTDADFADTRNTFTANSILTACGYLGLQIAKCLESYNPQWGYIVAADSGSKFRVDIRRPVTEKRGIDKEAFLTFASTGMQPKQTWVYSGYLRENDIGIKMSETGSAIVQIAYIGRVQVSAVNSDQYDRYAGKDTISVSYRS